MTPEEQKQLNERLTEIQQEASASHAQTPTKLYYRFHARGEEDIQKFLDAVNDALKNTDEQLRMELAYLAGQQSQI